MEQASSHLPAAAIARRREAHAAEEPVTPESSFANVVQFVKQGIELPGDVSGFVTTNSGTSSRFNVHNTVTSKLIPPATPNDPYRGTITVTSTSVYALRRSVDDDEKKDGAKEAPANHGFGSLDGSDETADGFHSFDQSLVGSATDGQPESEQKIESVQRRADEDHRTYELEYKNGRWELLSKLDPKTESSIENAFQLRPAFAALKPARLPEIPVRGGGIAKPEFPVGPTAASRYLVDTPSGCAAWGGTLLHSFPALFLWSASRSTEPLARSPGPSSCCEADGARVLVDCGLFQGLKQLRQRNWEPTPFDLKTLRAVVLTHAHLDHTGYLPRIVREGYAGPIYGTDATSELAEMILLDSAKCQEQDAEYANRKGYSKHKPALPLYEARDVERTVKLFRTQRRGEWFSPAEPIWMRYHDAGHLLGSNMIEVEIRDRTPPLRILFSGDVGRYDGPLYHDPAPPPPATIWSARAPTATATIPTDRFSTPWREWSTGRSGAAA